MDAPENDFPGAFCFLRMFASFTFWTTSNSRGRPGMPYAFKDGETAKHMVFSVRDGSATTRLVIIGSRPRSIHSTDA